MSSIYETTSPLEIVVDEEMTLSPAEGQCDCACALPAITRPLSNLVTRERLPDKPLVRNPLLRLLPLKEGFYVGFVPSGTGVAVINEGVKRLLAAFRSPKPAGEFSRHHLKGENPSKEEYVRVIQKLVGLRFLLPYGAPPLHLPVEREEVLTAWMHITNQCQLACPYCYVRKSNKTMNLQTGHAAIDAIFRSALAHHFHMIKLKYGGGEPTLHFSLVQQIHRYAAQAAERYDTQLDGVILSNGVGLTPSMLREMRESRLRLMISLDGLGEFHDAQRPFANGKGSFQRVAHAIEEALEIGIKPDISVTVGEYNIVGLPELLEWLLTRDLPFSLNFYRTPPMFFSEGQEWRLEREEENIIAGLKRAYKVIEQHLPRRTLLTSLLDRTNLAFPHLRPCRVKHSYLVIDPDGGISGCQMQIGDTITTVGDPDPLARVRTARQGIQNPSVDEREECQTCPWRYWCAGGCPLESYRASGSYKGKSPYCRIYKAFFPEVIRVEGLRLLAYHRAS